MKQTNFIVSYRKRIIPLLESKIYVYKNWDQNSNVGLPEQNAVLENIDDYSIHKSTVHRDLVVRDEEGELIVAKLSRRKAQCMGGN